MFINPYVTYIYRFCEITVAQVKNYAFFYLICKKSTIKFFNQRKRGHTFKTYLGWLKNRISDMDLIHPNQKTFNFLRKNWVFLS